MPRPKKPAHDGPKRRIVAEFVSDQAVDVSRLEAELAISGRSQQARDQQFISLAIGALIVIVDEIRNSSNVRFPCAQEVHSYIQARKPACPPPYSVIGEFQAQR